MVVHTFNPGTQEAEAGQTALQSELQDSQCYTEKETLSPKPKPTKQRISADSDVKGYIKRILVHC